jgi:histidinol phosphatase-like enzyme
MIYCFDIDGVLCDDMVGDYEKSKPRKDVIKKVNQLYDAGNIIKMFTGRGSKTGIDWRDFTEKQLKSWGVKYHELIFGKPVADVFIDDKAVNIKDLQNLIGFSPVEIKEELDEG